MEYIRRIEETMDRFYIVVDRKSGAFTVCLTITNLIQVYSSWNKTEYTHVYLVDLRETRLSVEEIPPKYL